MRIEREVHKPTVRLWIERYTIVMTRDSEEDLMQALQEIRDSIDEYLRESRKEPEKIWWKFRRG